MTQIEKARGRAAMTHIEKARGRAAKLVRAASLLIVPAAILFGACRVPEPTPPPPRIQDEDGSRATGEESEGSTRGAEDGESTRATGAGPVAGEDQMTEPHQDPDPPVPEGWKAVTLVEGLEHPWGMAFLPEGDILVTERPGRLRVIRDGELHPEPIQGVPEVFASGQGGLLDIALHPRFEENRLVYLTHSIGTRSENRVALSRGRFDEGRLTDLQRLFEAQPSKSGGQHFGSRLLWLPDGNLLMSIGDGGNPPLRIDGILARDHAQRLDSHLGSIIRLDDEGRAPADNPFRDEEGARPEIYSYGHRNIQGMTLDPHTRRVWVNEHGPRGGDELNLIRGGENHGWPIATFGADYRTRRRFTEHRTLPHTEAPKVVWTPAHAPSGLAFYDGDVFPAWRGSLFSGGLRSREVRRIILDGEQVVSQERLPMDARVRDVVSGPDGYLYLLTDEARGRLVRIEPQ